MFPFNKWPWTNYHELNLDWIVTRVRELYEWVNRTLKQFTEDLQQETSDRIEADQQLQTNIDNEQAAREAADQQLQENINAEAAAREQADQEEAEARQQADTQLQNNIDAEATARQQADTQLQANITAEATARQEADQQLQANITAEQTARELADQQLQQALDAETAARQQADQTETAAREAADTQLQNNINSLSDMAIHKDGSTTTTTAIPFAEGIQTPSITTPGGSTPVTLETGADLSSEKITNLAQGTDPTDAVNLQQMQAADEAAITEANSYTDTQLESVSAEIHSIPAGGESGQVLAKASATDYDVAWVEQSRGEGEVPAGGFAGQILTKKTATDYDTQWSNPQNIVDSDDNYDLWDTGKFYEFWLKTSVSVTFTKNDNSNIIAAQIPLPNWTGNTSISGHRGIIPFDADQDNTSITIGVVRSYVGSTNILGEAIMISENPFTSESNTIGISDIMLFRWEK